MSFPFLTSTPPLDLPHPSWAEQPIIYLAVAALCLVVVLRFLRKAVAPIGALFQAAAAAAVVAFAATIAFGVLLVAAYLTVR